MAVEFPDAVETRVVAPVRQRLVPLFTKGVRNVQAVYMSLKCTFWCFWAPALPASGDPGGASLTSVTGQVARFMAALCADRALQPTLVDCGLVHWFVAAASRSEEWSVRREAAVALARMLDPQGAESGVLEGDLPSTVASASSSPSAASSSAMLGMGPAAQAVLLDSKAAVALSKLSVEFPVLLRALARLSMAEPRVEMPREQGGLHHETLDAILTLAERETQDAQRVAAWALASWAEDKEDAGAMYRSEGKDQRGDPETRVSGALLKLEGHSAKVLDEVVRENVSLCVSRLSRHGGPTRTALVEDGWIEMCTDGVKDALRGLAKLDADIAKLVATLSVTSDAENQGQGAPSRAWSRVGSYWHWVSRSGADSKGAAQRSPRWAFEALTLEADAKSLEELRARTRRSLGSFAKALQFLAKDDTSYDHFLESETLRQLREVATSVHPVQDPALRKTLVRCLANFTSTVLELQRRAQLPATPARDLIARRGTGKGRGTPAAAGGEGKLYEFPEQEKDSWTELLRAWKDEPGVDTGVQLGSCVALERLLQLEKDISNNSTVREWMYEILSAGIDESDHSDVGPHGMLQDPKKREFMDKVLIALAQPSSDPPPEGLQLSDSPVISWVQDLTPQMVGQAVKALSIKADGGTEVQEQLVHGGILQLLKQLYVRVDEPKVRKYTCKTIANLSASLSDAVHQALADDGWPERLQRWYPQVAEWKTAAIIKRALENLRQAELHRGEGGSARRTRLLDGVYVLHNSRRSGSRDRVSDAPGGIDIVFIHGLRGHAFKTWMQAPETGQTPAHPLLEGGAHQKKKPTDDANLSRTSVNLSGMDDWNEKGGSLSPFTRRALGSNLAPAQGGEAYENGDLRSPGQFSSDEDVESTHDMETRSLWMDWLSEDFTESPSRANDRMMTVGYKSVIVGSSLNLREIASDVRQRLKTAKVGENGRYVVFVTHSMGGLIVKEMLRQDALDTVGPEGDSKSDGVRDWEGHLARQTLGLICFATPHSGSELAYWEESLSPVFKAASVVRDLRPDAAHHPILNDLLARLYKEKRLRLLSFGESRPSHVIPFLSDRLGSYHDVIVSLASANPGVGEFHPVDADHYNVCKCPSRTRFPYTNVLNFVRQCAADAETRSRLTAERKTHADPHAHDAAHQ